MAVEDSDRQADAEYRYEIEGSATLRIDEQVSVEMEGYGNPALEAQKQVLQRLKEDLRQAGVDLAMFDLDTRIVDVESEIPDGIELVEVTFHPQVWQDERAVTGTDTEQFYVPADDATDDDGNLLPDNSRESDVLRLHSNAPVRARHWQGPFYVTLERVDESGGEQ